MKKLFILLSLSRFWCFSVATPTTYTTLLFLLLFSFPAYSQFTGGNGGGSDKAQIRTKTILSIENEQERAFFEQIKITSQPNFFLVEWNDKIILQQIEIIDILGRVQKTISISEFQKAISFPFSGADKAKGIYFVRFRDDEGRFFSRKIVF
ncbi:T9SS type A sorting domain-containing protein [Bernardetia sp. ABR2-2B]|uniref:T9SS type A sorting domain-containing protein n=1 Tax=Bernardetia sp. ABR2-2B TaxID=3127472 RepID=UPI0030CE5BA7